MKAKFRGFLGLAGAIILLSGCANPINERTAQRYFELGVAAERANDLVAARRGYGNARGNAQLGRLGPAAEARFLYEQARVTGYAGDFTEAETEFLEVLVLIDKARPAADPLLPPALAEYSRLLHDTGQHQKAVPVFERALVELERVGLEKSDPLGFAAFLEDFGESLAAADRADRAAAVRARAAELRQANREATARFVARRYRVDSGKP